jgi:hypothetical protein
MAPGHTLQATDTIAPIGPFGARPHRIWHAPGAPTSSSASLEWPQATPLKPPTRSPPIGPRGPSPPDVARAPVMIKRLHRLIPPHVTRLRRPKPGPEKSVPSAKPPVPVAGGADPGSGAERLSERHFGGEPAAHQWFRIRVLRDVA